MFGPQAVIFPAIRVAAASAIPALPPQTVTSSATPGEKLRPVHPLEATPQILPSPRTVSLPIIFCEPVFFSPTTALLSPASRRAMSPPLFTTTLSAPNRKAASAT